MNSNRQEILDLLAKGKITAEEAADLLSQPSQPEPPEPETAVSPTPTAEKAPPPVPEPEVSYKADTVSLPDNGSMPTWFRVRVRNLETGKNKVSVNIPVRMLKFGMRIGKRFTSELDDLNWNEIDSMVSNMQTGMLVEVQDEESNEHVQVFLE